jgi:hypothetical protein
LPVIFAGRRHLFAAFLLSSTSLSFVDIRARSLLPLLLTWLNPLNHPPPPTIAISMIAKMDSQPPPAAVINDATVNGDGSGSGRRVARVQSARARYPILSIGGQQLILRRSFWADVFVASIFVFFSPKVRGRKSYY